MSLALLDGYPELLERVISKLEWHSYARLQQTCRFFTEFVKGNRKFRINVSKYCELKPDGTMVISGRNANQVADVNSLNGLCFQHFKFPQNINAFDVNAFEKCCNMFIKHNITAKYMPLNANYNNKEMNVKKCEALFQILNPLRVTLNSKGSRRFQALLQAQHLQELYLHVDPSNTVQAMEQLYPHVRKMSLLVWPEERRDSDEVLEEVISILKILRSKTLPSSSHDFFFQDKIENPLPPLDQLIMMFYDFDLTVVDNNQEDYPRQHLRLHCNLGYNLGYCIISLGGCGALIEYNKSG